MTDRDNQIQKAKDFINEERRNLMAKSYRHFMQIKEEDTKLADVVASVRSSIDNLASGKDDIDRILAEQALILDATFHFYLDKSLGAYTDMDKVELALKAQRQSERAMKVLHRIQKQKDEKVQKEEKKFGKQSERFYDSLSQERWDE